MAAVNDNQKTYRKAVKVLGNLNYKKNPYTDIVLNADYGKMKAFVLKNVIPANYFIAKEICKKVFSG